MQRRTAVRAWLEYVTLGERETRTSHFAVPYSAITYVLKWCCWPTVTLATTILTHHRNHFYLVWPPWVTFPCWVRFPWQIPFPEVISTDEVPSAIVVGAVGVSSLSPSSSPLVTVLDSVALVLVLVTSASYSGTRPPEPLSPSCCDPLVAEERTVMSSGRLTLQSSPIQPWKENVLDTGRTYIMVTVVRIACANVCCDHRFKGHCPMLQTSSTISLKQ